YLYLREYSGLGWPRRIQAREAFRQARECAEFFRSRFTDPQHRKRVLGEALPIYDYLVEINVDLWQTRREPEAFHEAFEAAEASRARNLMDLLADEVLQPANTLPELVE